jgi:rubrerythrin
MSYFFSADEVFEMAVQLEKNGAAFYRKAAKQCTAKVEQEMLVGLAQMEDDHRKTFEAMRSELIKDDDSDWNDPEGEALRYLQAFAGGHVFDLTADPSEFIKPGTATRDVLIKALGCERESILFYTGMKALIPHALGRDKIDAIITEEVGHVALLSDKLEALGTK